MFEIITGVVCAAVILLCCIPLASVVVQIIKETRGK